MIFRQVFNFIFSSYFLVSCGLDTSSLHTQKLYKNKNQIIEYKGEPISVETHSLSAKQEKLLYEDETYHVSLDGSVEARELNLEHVQKEQKRVQYWYQKGSYKVFNDHQALKKYQTGHGQQLALLQSQKSFHIIFDQHTGEVIKILELKSNKNEESES